MERRSPTAALGVYDGIYDDLLAAYHGLSAEQQRQLTASLLVCLCHRIGDRDEIQRAIEEAKASLPQPRAQNVKPKGQDISADPETGIDTASLRPWSGGRMCRLPDDSQIAGIKLAQLCDFRRPGAPQEFDRETLTDL